jgi:hypothetical protein
MSSEDDEYKDIYVEEAVKASPTKQMKNEGDYMLQRADKLRKRRTFNASKTKSEMTYE